MRQFLKCLLDFVLALVGILVWVLVHPILAFLIRRDSPGPVFYRQERVGRGGKPIVIRKYRTMLTDAEADGTPRWSVPPDPRVTRVGHHLRRWGLDELPQFLSVLLGEMSVVGPRPERAYFYEKYPQLNGERLRVRPGITGLAQVHQRSVRDEHDVQVKLDYDLKYIREQSLLLDLSIMLSTIALLLRGRDV